MKTPTRVRFATIASAALAVAASLPANAGVVHATAATAQPAFASNPIARLKALYAPPPRAHMPLGGRHHGGPMATSYTIDDIGAPAQKSLELETPQTFNNTGQMVGYDYNIVTNSNNCVAYTGSRWVTVTSPSFYNCYPMSMTNSNPSTGSFTFVGYGGAVHDRAGAAFTATVSGARAHLRVFGSYDGSQLQGINNAGNAVGYAYYAPRKGFFDNSPPFLLHGNSFRPLQPQCTTDEPLCMNAVVTDNETTYCPFGGCSLNDENVVLGYDYESDWFYEILPLGGSGSAQNLPIPYDTTYPVGINNAMQIAYAEYVPSEGYEAWQYSVGSSQPVALGTLPGSSCLEYYPISQSNTGEVLGYAFDCSGPATYWTWDPVNGMQDLDAAIPPNSYTNITPYGVNDAGQILVELDDSGNTHWGTLVPTPSAKHHKR